MHNCRFVTVFAIYGMFELFVTFIE